MLRRGAQRLLMDRRVAQAYLVDVAVGEDEARERAAVDAAGVDADLVRQADDHTAVRRVAEDHRGAELVWVVEEILPDPQQVLGALVVPRHAGSYARVDDAIVVP